MSRHVSLFLAVVPILVSGLERAVAAGPLQNAGSADPGGSFFTFDTQIAGSNNKFYGLEE